MLRLKMINVNNKTDRITVKQLAAFGKLNMLNTTFLLVYSKFIKWLHHGYELLCPMSYTQNIFYNIRTCITVSRSFQSPVSETQSTQTSHFRSVLGPWLSQQFKTWQPMSSNYTAIVLVCGFNYRLRGNLLNWVEYHCWWLKSRSKL